MEILNTNKVPKAMKKAEKNTNFINRSSRKESVKFLDLFLFAFFVLEGSNPKLCAGGPSIRMLIHKICIAFRG